MPTTRYCSRAALALVLGCGLLACGDDDSTLGGGPTGGAGGAGASGGADPAGGAPALVMPTAGITDCATVFVDDDGACRPSLDKCPLGSIPDVDAGCVGVGVPNCAPQFVDARGVCLPAISDCEAGSFPVPTLGCVSIDGAAGCGTGTWGNVADDPINVYVDASYQGGSSDGSIGQPFVSLPEALAVAAAGSRVVMAAGQYTAPAPVTTDLELRGVCASQVTLTAAVDAQRVLTLAAPLGGTIALSDVTVSASVPGIRVESGNALISRVHVRGVSYKAVEVGGPSTTATIDASLIEDTTNGGNGDVGIGVQVLGGAELAMQSSAVIRARTAALQAIDGALVADDVFIAETQADGGGYGNAAAAQSAGSLTLRRSVLRDNFGGVYVAASATIEDSVLGVVFDQASDKISMVDGSLALRRSAVVDGDTWAITVYAGQQGLVLIEHVLVADIAAGDLGGSGISLSEPGTVRRSAFTRNVGPSLTALRDTQIDGVVVEDTFFDPSLGVGAGIVALDGGAITIDRSYLRGVEDAAVLTAAYTGGDGTFSLTRSRIEALPGVDGYAGIGVGLTAATVAARIEATVIEDVRTAGVMAIDAPLVIERSIVRTVAAGNISRLPDGDTEAGPIADGILFLGTSAEAGIAADDVWIEGAERAGLLLSAGAHTLERVRVSGSGVGVGMRDAATFTQSECDLASNDVPVEDPSALPIPPP